MKVETIYGLKLQKIYLILKLSLGPFDLITKVILSRLWFAFIELLEKYMGDSMLYY